MPSMNAKPHEDTRDLRWHTEQGNQRDSEFLFKDLHSVSQRKELRKRRQASLLAGRSCSCLAPSPEGAKEEIAVLELNRIPSTREGWSTHKCVGPLKVGWVVACTMHSRPLENMHDCLYAPVHPGNQFRWFP